MLLWLIGCCTSRDSIAVPLDPHAAALTTMPQRTHPHPVNRVTISFTCSAPLKGEKLFLRHGLEIRMLLLFSHVPCNDRLLLLGKREGGLITSRIHLPRYLFVAFLKENRICMLVQRYNMYPSFFQSLHLQPCHRRGQGGIARDAGHAQRGEMQTGANTGESNRKKDLVSFFVNYCFLENGHGFALCCKKPYVKSNK